MRILHLGRECLNPDYAGLEGYAILLRQSCKIVLGIGLEHNFGDKPMCRAFRLGDDLEVPRELGDREEADADLADEPPSTGAETRIVLAHDAEVNPRPRALRTPA